MALRLWNAPMTEDSGSRSRASSAAEPASTGSARRGALHEHQGRDDIHDDLASKVLLKVGEGVLLRLSTARR